MDGNGTAKTRAEGTGSNPLDRDPLWRPGMDPKYSSHKGDYPWTKAAASGEMPRTDARATRAIPSDPVPPNRDLALVEWLLSEHTKRLKAELPRRLQMMPTGVRIRNLRAALDWTQCTIAMELGISARTVMRHESGRNRPRPLRLSILLRLREMESLYAEDLIAYLGLSGPTRP